MMFTTAHNSPGVHVRYLSIIPSLTDAELLAFIQLFPLLEHLILESSSEITDTSFQHVPRLCPHLRTISLNEAAITQMSMVALGQHCRQLSNVHLKHCCALNVDMFLALHDCPLREIDITGCHLLDLTNPKSHWADFTMATLAKFQQLTKSILVDQGYDYTPLMHAANTMGLSWPCLQEIRLNGYKERCVMDDAMAIAWIMAHPQMTTVAWCYGNLTDDTLDAICDYLPTIETLCVDGNRGITSTGIRHVIRYCTNLMGGVDCFDCGIHFHDADFPRDLYRPLYKFRTEMEEPNAENQFELDEVVWVNMDPY